MISTILFVISSIVILCLSPKIWKKPILGVAILALTLPFERIPSYDIPFAWGITVRPSQIAAIVIIMVFFAKWLLKKWNYKINWLVASFGGFLSIAAVTIFIAQNKQRAFLVWIFTCFVMICAFVISNIIKNKKDLIMVKAALYWGTLIVTIFGLIQFIGRTVGIPDHMVWLRSEYGKNTIDYLGFPRIQSFALEPLYYANFLIISFALFLMFAFYKIYQKNSDDAYSLKKYLIILSLIMVNFVLTFSRGIYATVVVVLVASLFFIGKKAFSKKSLMIWSPLCLSIVIGIVMMLGSSYYLNSGTSKFRDTENHVIDLKNDTASVQPRVGGYKSAHRAFTDNPILGVGIGNYGPWFAEYPPKAPEGGWNVVNNDPLEILAEEGIIGFLLFAAACFCLIFLGIKAILRTKNPYYKCYLSAIFLAILGIGVQYQTFSTLCITHIWTAIGIYAALIFIIRNKSLLKADK